MAIDEIILANNVRMPRLGYGVFKITDPKECQQCVLDALEVGYRSIDTAQTYQNEEAVGRALQASDVAREDIFLTTKVWLSEFGEGKTYQSVEGSLRRLKTDYIDLILIHQPFNDYYGAYRDLERLYREGKVRAIGVSNFNADRYLDLVAFCDVIPHINQVETHVYNQQEELRKVCAEYGTVVEAWGPFAQAAMGFFEDPTLQKIGAKYNKSTAQIGLRYLIQNDIVAIPKSVHKERMIENGDIFDFELTDDDLDAIRQLDRKETVQAPHWDPDRVKKLTGLN